MPAKSSHHQKLKVMTVLGTRPEIIRLSRVIAALDRHVDHVLVHTGQNYDYELSELFFEDLGVRKPDHFLDAVGETLGETLGQILAKSEAVLAQEKPDAFLVLGDTNSALSALMARRMKVPIYHMEAGNRCFDRNVPEETNRRVVDHTADFNLTYTEHARRHLLAEGMAHRRIYVTGSPMQEVLTHFEDKIAASNILSELNLQAGGYFIVSMHREENIDSVERLSQLSDALNAMAAHFDKPVIVSTHPRTRNRLDRLEGGQTLDERISWMKPFGFHDYNQLQRNCFCALSDSGTIAEEASMLGFPAVTPRDSIERPEGLDVGCLIMTGLNKERIIDAIEVVTAQHKARKQRGESQPLPQDYAITNTSERVLNLIVGTAKLSNQWDGIRED